MQKPVATPVVLWFEEFNEVLQGTATQRGSFLGSDLDVRGRVGKVRCVGESRARIVPPTAYPPHRCDGLRGEARLRCEERRNRSACPGSRRVASGSGRADAFQMAEFGRRFGRRLRVSPVVFEADRSARAYRKLALQTGGAFVQVPSLGAAAAALPSLLAGGVRAVYARHLGSGERSADLLGADGRSFSGALQLAPGAIYVELRVEGERGPAAHFRFRVYSAGASLRGYLADLRRSNDALARRAESLRAAAPPAAPLRPAAATPLPRKVEVATEP